MLFLNSALNKTLTKLKNKKSGIPLGLNTNNIASLPFSNNTAVITTSNSHFLRIGIVMLIAISLHNIPEGMAIGSSNVVSTNLSFMLSILLLLHDIPEGMAVTTPFCASGVSKTRTFLLVLLSGTTTILGGVVGKLLGGLSSVSICICLSFAAGAMLYVSFFEILPESFQTNSNKAPSVFLMLGVLIGFIFTSVL